MVIVLTQLVHAVVYAVIVEGMYEAISDGNANYILYLLCVLFLFKAEKIVKQIFNVRSAANTVGDLAASGAAAFAVTKSIGGVFKKSDGGGAQAEDKNDEKKETENVDMLRNAHQANMTRKQVEAEESKYTTRSSQEAISSNSGGGGTNTQAQAGSPNISPETLRNGGSSTVAGNRPINRLAPMGRSSEISDFDKVRIIQNQKALKAKNGGRARRVAKFVVRNSGRLVGATVGLAVGAAAGDATKAMTAAATLGTVGSKLGNGVTRIADVGINRFAGHRMKVKSLRGDYIKDLRKAGVSEEFIAEIYDTDKIEDAYQKAKGEAIRKALANEMSGTRRGGKTLGNVKLIGTIERENQNNLS